MGCLQVKDLPTGVNPITVFSLISFLAPDDSFFFLSDFYPSAKLFSRMLLRVEQFTSKRLPLSHAPEPPPLPSFYIFYESPPLEFYVSSLGD